MIHGIGKHPLANYIIRHLKLLLFFGESVNLLPGC